MSSNRGARYVVVMLAGTAVGLVGCGAWGRFILRDLVSLGARVAVVARSEESKSRATEGGAHEVVRELGELPEVEALVVATPTSTHAEVVGEALERGVPVFVEKPLTNDPASAERLAAAAGGRLFVMDKWRYHPGVELLAELARTEALGPVRGVHTTRVGWGNPHDDVDAVWVLAPHDLSIALEVLRELPEARAATGDGDDLVGLLGADPWAHVEVSARSPVRRREVRLVCDGGVALLADGYSEHVLVRREGGEEERRGISTELPLLRELRAFLDHVHGGPPPRSSAPEGALVVRRIQELRALAGIA